MTIKEKVQRLIQAVADYERADLHLQFLPGAGYFKHTEPDAEEARVPWRDALGASRDRASAEIRAARAALEEEPTIPEGESLAEFADRIADEIETKFAGEHWTEDAIAARDAVDRLFDSVSDDPAGWRK